MASIILINLFFLLSSFPPLCLDRVSKESTSFAIITLTREGGIQLYRSYHKEREVFSANSRCAKLVLPHCLLYCRKVLGLLFNNADYFRCEMRVNSYWDPTSCQGCFVHIFSCKKKLR